MRVLFFGGLREVVGGGEILVPIAVTGATVFSLREGLQLQWPAVGAASIRWAVNEEFVPLTHPLRDGDTVAVLPPLAGG